MTHVVEHKSFRYSWELVRHTYILDLESDIEIQQVVISPQEKDHLQPPPYSFTRFFEVEIDQIQKNGKTVSSFRNICPVEIRENQDWNFLKPLMNSGSSRVTRRFQSQDGDIETRWLYTDDFFLIALSSGDRHDLDMLLSLIIQKLNMIALSIQSGRRIHSEFENQQKYRAAMSTMFSEGVDGAFRDVPVYQQHGDMTGSDIDVSAALMSAELQDLTEECAYEKPAGKGSIPADTVIPAGISRVAVPVEKAPAEMVVAEGAPEEIIAAEITQTENTRTHCIPAAPAAAECDPFANIVIKGTFTEAVLEEPGLIAEGTATESGTVAETAAKGVLAESIPEEIIAEEIPPTENTRTRSNPAIPAAEESNPFANIVLKSAFAEAVFGERAATAEGSPTESGTVAETAAKGVRAESIPEEHAPVQGIPATMSCSRCGAGISGTTKFCGSCGAAVSTAPPAEGAPATVSCSSCGAGISGTTKFCSSCGTAVSTAPPAEGAPVSPGITASAGDDTSPTGSRSAAGPVVNLKSIKELEDLSWLTD